MILHSILSLQDTFFSQFSSVFTLLHPNNALGLSLNTTVSAPSPLPLCLNEYDVSVLQQISEY